VKGLNVSAFVAVYYKIINITLFIVFTMFT